jgi:hypothetical protein
MTAIAMGAALAAQRQQADNHYFCEKLQFYGSAA